jgi:hypothetical protein
MQTLPTPPALPTLPPNTRLPAPNGQLPAQRQVAMALATETPVPTVTIAPLPLLTPSAVPSAFAQTNVFTFGSPPQSNFARPSDPVQIFYATLSPTVVADGTSVRVAVVTTTNVSSVKLIVGSQSVALRQTGPGQWQATFPFPLTAVPSGQTNMLTSLVASPADGTSATAPIPISANRL